MRPATTFCLMTRQLIGDRVRSRSGSGLVEITIQLVAFAPDRVFDGRYIPG